MALIEWNEEKFTVKVPSVDEQHKKLVEIINKLHDSMLTGTSKNTLKEVISELLDYTQKHFTYEEELQQKAGYLDFEDHKKMHDAFVDKVISFQEKYLKGEIFLSIDIINFLKDWLIHHILDADKQYVDSMVSKGFQ